MKKSMLLLLIFVMALVVFTTGAFAATKITAIKAFLDGDLTLVKDGEVWQPVDANGKIALPVTYNGTTYLPIRAISDAFNIPIQYEGKTKTIRLGESENVSFYTSGIKPETATWTFQDIIDKKQLVFGGKQYNGAFAMAASDTERYSLSIDLGRKYASLHLIIAGDKDLKFKLYNDKQQLLTRELTVKEGQVTVYDIDLQGSKGITIHPYGAAIGASPLVYILKDSYLK
ncbi:stalk domain-containing protein [Cohnella abietis]|uniref:Copper amine oxidase-like N-terminal domain-containing protein n=1 Tax=Cohnella abietis TaxID=2507935 RepID=A0A3T1CYR7_9BACL|nr:stalk domain-containing protein [Cohnella abietis]BBI30895.1 hypothetical protein KCTCHS21_02940 [Cohnella abietis]